MLLVLMSTELFNDEQVVLYLRVTDVGGKIAREIGL